MRLMSIMLLGSAVALGTTAAAGDDRIVSDHENGPGGTLIKADESSKPEATKFAEAYSSTMYEAIGKCSKEFEGEQCKPGSPGCLNVSTWHLTATAGTIKGGCSKSDNDARGAEIDAFCSCATGKVDTSKFTATKDWDVMVPVGWFIEK